MFAPERIRIIKGMLLEKKHINVSDLSILLNVSEVTIRRDLEKLESEGFLTRTHGGAIISENITQEEETYSEEQNDSFLEERIHIADIAIHTIEDNDIILLSPGPTNLIIARKLYDKKNITVLTNDLNIASEFSSNNNVKVILTGGDLDLTSMTLSGKLAEENIKKFFVSKAYIEVEGISTLRGYTVQSMDRASIIKEMVNITRETIIIGTYNCFDNISFSQIGPLTIANKVITNPSIPDEYKNYYFDKKIQLFTAFNCYEGGI